MSPKERDPMDVAHEAAEQKLCDDLMNRDAEIRIAMCELCGFTVDDVERDDDGLVKRIWVSYPASWTGTPTQPWPPDFLKDLNAVHSFECGYEWGKGCTPENPSACINPPWIAYDMMLNSVVGQDRHLTIRATAAQRCEAILKTTGKWNTKWENL
jgi:hypothetical protein